MDSKQSGLKDKRVYNMPARWGCLAAVDAVREPFSILRLLTTETFASPRFTSLSGGLNAIKAFTNGPGYPFYPGRFLFRNYICSSIQCFSRFIVVKGVGCNALTSCLE